ncbi:MAG: thioredoxin domain-containing protein [Candidatus Omnitrophica bacterium]|nr:thioredoxin domain-containing protein [Candidatus Omnitrophota bacterium]
MAEPFTNRLIKEKSPYLLQHAHNPIDWYPWGEEALAKARKEEKPIFLSIGYSACHWCHVMEKEAFSNIEVAQILNDNFIAVKVDREERPDLDNIYMSAVTAMTGRGGWPLTIILTPELKPFYGGTYFYPEDALGNPGLKTILNAITQGWKSRKGEIIATSEALSRAISDIDASSENAPALDEAVLDKAYKEFLLIFDPLYAGFGRAPKFSNGHTISFLMRYWKRTRAQKSLEMAQRTLISLSRGGIYDHIGGGFHRYTIDEQWRIPHFEKMLYDQAMLSKAYLEAYQAAGREEYLTVAKGIFEYVLGEMASPEGAFYSAQDADSAYDAASPDKKEEGAFYFWTSEELSELLGEEAARIAGHYFGIEANGNIETGKDDELKGKNILFVASDFTRTAAYFGKTEKEIDGIIQDSRRKLFSARAKRPKPSFDDKVLSDWNGLMISSLAFSFRVLKEPRYLIAAKRAADFIIQKMITAEGELFHRYRDNEAAIPGMIEDYAFFIQGLLDLYEATFELPYLRLAKTLAEKFLLDFWDNSNSGFFFTADKSPGILARRKDIYDGAIPSGNSIAALDLLRLAGLLGERNFERKAEAALAAFSSKIWETPSAYAQALIALDFVLGPHEEIVIAADKTADAEEMLLEIHKRFLPNKVVMFRPKSPDEAVQVINLAPFSKDYILLEDKPTAYVCVNHLCNSPTNSIETLKQKLDGLEK